MELFFHKYHGTGNDFVLIDNQGKQLEHLLAQAQIAWLCHRRFGIGADGVMLLSDSEAAAFRMIYYNADGAESTMCGNGGRCIAAFARQMGLIGDTSSFEAIDGIHEVHFQHERVALHMQPPKGMKKLNPTDCWIDTGSPHYVRFSTDRIHSLDVAEIGASIRYSEPYQSQGGTNVNFVETQGDGLHVRTYERGVEGETYSCGTGVVASAYSHWVRTQLGKNQDARIACHTPGGTLWVEVLRFQGIDEQLILEGPATFVFSGRISIPERLPTAHIASIQS